MVVVMVIWSFIPCNNCNIHNNNNNNNNNVGDILKMIWRMEVGEVGVIPPDSHRDQG